MDFVAELAATVELPEPIVEFGSLQVEPDQPNDLRRLLRGRDFTGTDIRPGPGVDRVEDLRRLSYQDGTIGTALCLDTLEHCEDPRQACRELHRVLRPGGLCVITSVMLFPIHGYPNDYWRFTPEGFRVLLEPFDAVDVIGIGHPDVPTQVIGVGRSGGDLGFSLVGVETLTSEQERWRRAEGKVRFGVVHVPLRALVTTLAGELPRAVRERAKARLGRSS